MRSAAFEALGTTAVVAVSDDAALADARRSLARHLADVEATCSRFRADSELSRVNARAGEPVLVSSLFADAIRVALGAAESTGGLVDPILGADLRAAGYDRTFTRVRERDGWIVVPAPRRRDAWREVRLDGAVLRMPPGAELDLGATAKAWTSDCAARAIARETGAGVLISLGGDVAVAGTAPAGGWPVRIADDHRTPLDGEGPVVSIESGGLATSSTTVRRWQTDRGVAHHVLDPRSGRPAKETWRTVTVAARTCVDANVAATAAIVLGDAAVAWLEARGVHARLVAADGAVIVTGDWPAEAEAA